jgi:hypothetical protein
MAADALVDSKFEASKQFANSLVQRGAPLLAAFWDFHEDVDRWTLVLVPTSPEERRRLIKQATDLLVEPPYRAIFSISDPLVDSHQIDRARALGAYIRYEPYIGRRFDTTFTNGEFFESVVPVYFKPELLTRLAVAS